MNDLPRVMEALRNADASGNTEDARRLAQIASRMRDSEPAQQEQQEPQQEGGFGSFVGQGLTGPISEAVDFIHSGMKKLPLMYKGDNPFMGTKWAEEKMGVPSRPPRTPLEYAGRGAGEVAAALVPSTLVIKGIKGVGIAGRVAAEIYKSMVKYPKLTMAGEFGGGFGAGLGSYAEEEKGVTGGELMGGVAGGVLPSAIINAPIAGAVKVGGRLLKRVGLPFTEAGAKYRAGKYLKGQIVSPVKTADILGKETLGDLPPAIVAGERRMTVLYKSLVNQDAVSEYDAVESTGRSIVKLEGEMRKLGYGSTEILADVTRRRVTAIKARLDNKILEATKRAQDRYDALSVAGRKADESTIVRNEIEKVMRLENDKVKDLWLDVPKDHPVGVANTRQQYTKLMDELAYSQKADMPDVLTNDPIIKNKKMDITVIREMQGLRSKLLEGGRVARKNGEWNKARLSDDMADAILEDMGVSAEGTIDDVATSLKTAIDATREFKTRFNQGIVGKVLGFDKTGAPQIDPTIALQRSIGRLKDVGAVDIDKLMVTPEAKEATKRFLTRSFTDYARDARTGVIDPSKTSKFIRENESILDRFPELRTQLTDVGEAQKLANQTARIMEARKVQLQNPNVSYSARFIGASDMGKAVDSVFTAKNPRLMVRDLLNKAKKDKTGHALEGLRGGFVDYIWDKSKTGGFNELGEKVPSGRAMLGFIRNNDYALKGVFTPEQMGKMKRVGSELARIESFEKTPSGGKVEIEMKDIASSALRLFSRIGGAQVGRVIAGATGGGTVQTPGIVSDRFQMFAKSISNDKAFQMVHDAILSKDPTLLRSLLLPITKPNGKVSLKNLMTVVDKMELWLFGAGSRVLGDEE